MKSISVYIPILIFHCFGATSARNVLYPEMKMYSKSDVDNWLDMPIKDLEMQCTLKNKESEYEKLMSEFHDQLIKFMTPIEEQDVEESDFIFHHIYNLDLVMQLKEVISAIQNCLDDENRLDSEGVVKVMERVLKAHAIKVVQIDPLRKEDIECIKSNIELLDPEACRDLLPSNGVLYDMTIRNSLTMESIKNSTCEKNLPYEKCVMKYAKSCNSKVEKLFKVLMSPAEIGICDNFLQKTYPDMVEDITNVFNRKENPLIFKKLLRL